MVRVVCPGGVVQWTRVSLPVQFLANLTDENLLIPDAIPVFAVVVVTLHHPKYFAVNSSKTINIIMASVTRMAWIRVGEWKFILVYSFISGWSLLDSCWMLVVFCAFLLHILWTV